LDALGLKNALRAIGRGHRQIEAIFVLGSRERETRSQVTTRNSKRSFSELPISAKYIHAAGLCAVALAITLLMTPAALHRIAFRGEDDKAFFRIGSWLVVAAVCPLALGISSDVYVVFFKITQNPAAAAMAVLLSLLLLLVLWYALPLWLRLVKNGDSERVPQGRQ
jgi:Family of unknown function (DUF6328)